MRGMAPGPAGEQPFLGQVLDEIRAGGNLPLRQRAQDIGSHEALRRLQVGKASGAVELRVVPLVVAWAIPALLEDAVGAALRHALGHEVMRRRTRRKVEADGWCLHRHGSLWARCSSRAGCGYSPLQYAPELRRWEYQEPRSFVRRSILQRWMGHQLGSVSLVGSPCGARGGGVPLACAFMAAATAAAICSSRDRAWAWRSSSVCWRLRSAASWPAARVASQPGRMSRSPGRL